MTYTPIPAGTLNWDVPVNAALSDLDSRETADAANIATNSANITTNTGNIATNTSNISALQTTTTTQAGQISALQTSDSTQNTNITNLQTGKLDLTGGTLTGALSGTTFTGSGTSQVNNLRLGASGNFGGSTGGVLAVQTVTTTPTSNPTQGFVLYGTATAAEIRQQDGSVLNGTRASQLQGGAGPSVQGFLSWTYDTETATASGASVNVSGTVYLHKLFLPANVTVSNIHIGVQTAGATLTAAQNLLGIYDSTGTRKGQTADQSGVWTSTGFKTAALTASYTTTAAGFHYIAVLAVGTTPPAFNQVGTAPSALFNGNTSGATLRHATNGTSQTSLAASLTLSSNASSAFNVWCAVS